MRPVATVSVLDDVYREREAQHRKWGEQNHPDGTSTEVYQARADITRDLTNMAAEAGSLTWVDILSEEVYEALAEEDPGKLRDELVQVAAVAVAWIEALDRRPA